MAACQAQDSAGVTCIAGRHHHCVAHRHACGHARLTQRWLAGTSVWEQHHHVGGGCDAVHVVVSQCGLAHDHGQPKHSRGGQ